MINFRLCILLLCSFVIAEEYISIELSDSKKELSQEIFKKLNNEHYCWVLEYEVRKEMQGAHFLKAF